MNHFFQFEADFVESLRCIPMIVRMKLDLCGIKLKLSHWHHLNQDDRQALVELPCTTASEIQAYRDFLHRLILERTGTVASDLPIDPHPAWRDDTTIPTSVQDKAQEFGAAITSTQWSQLTHLQRFALIKLSRPGHENKNFPFALKEFHLHCSTSPSAGTKSGQPVLSVSK